MKKNLKITTIILLGIAFTISFASCSSDDNQTSQIQEDNFYALRVGNSWVYKNYALNFETGDYDYTGIIDSVSIVETEVVNDHEYFKFRRKTTGNTSNGCFLCYENGIFYELLRDSIGYLVRDDGKIIYANNDFSARILYDDASWGIVYEELQQDSYTVNVEAGTFDCLDTEWYVIATDPDDQDQFSGVNHYYYSKEGMGFVSSTLTTPGRPYHLLERRLDSYDIQ